MRYRAFMGLVRVRVKSFPQSAGESRRVFGVTGAAVGGDLWETRLTIEGMESGKQNGKREGGKAEKQGRAAPWPWTYSE